MAVVKFTKALKRFFPTLGEHSTERRSLPEVLHEINLKYPGIQTYIVDEQGSLRKHVNIFINGDMIDDRAKLADRFEPDMVVPPIEILIFESLYGAYKIYFIFNLNNIYPG